MKLVDLMEAVGKNVVYHSVQLNRQNLDNMERIADGEAWIAHGTHPGSLVHSRKHNKTDEVTDVDNEHEVGEQGALGTSVTRSKHTALESGGKAFGPIVYVLDRDKIAADNRIVPVDYFRGRAKQRAHTGTHETEEFIVGDIKNFAAKIVAIHILPTTYTKSVQLETALANLKRRHPHVNIVDTGKEQRDATNPMNNKMDRDTLLEPLREIDKLLNKRLIDLKRNRVEPSIPNEFELIQGIRRQVFSRVNPVQTAKMDDSRVYKTFNSVKLNWAEFKKHNSYELEGDPLR